MHQNLFCGQMKTNSTLTGHFHLQAHLSVPPPPPEGPRRPIHHKCAPCSTLRRGLSQSRPGTRPAAARSPSQRPASSPQARAQGGKGRSDTEIRVRGTTKQDGCSDALPAATAGPRTKGEPQRRPSKRGPIAAGAEAPAPTPAPGLGPARLGARALGSGARPSPPRALSQQRPRDVTARTTTPLLTMPPPQAPPGSARAANRSAEPNARGPWKAEGRSEIGGTSSCTCAVAGGSRRPAPGIRGQTSRSRRACPGRGRRRRRRRRGRGICAGVAVVCREPRSWKTRDLLNQMREFRFML